MNDGLLLNQLFLVTHKRLVLMRNAIALRYVASRCIPLKRMRAKAPYV